MTIDQLKALEPQLLEYINTNADLQGLLAELDLFPNGFNKESKEWVYMLKLANWHMDNALADWWEGSLKDFPE